MPPVMTVAVVLFAAAAAAAGPLFPLGILNFPSSFCISYVFIRFSFALAIISVFLETDWRINGESCSITLTGCFWSVVR